MKSGAILPFLFLSACGIHEIPFWTEQLPPTDRRVISAEAAPCGAIAIVRVRNLRDVNDNPDLQADAVYELDPQGSVKAEWSVPANFEPLAVFGNKLLVDGFWIGQDGGLVRAHPARHIKPEFLATCRIPDQLKPTEYGQCVSLVDLSTGAKRTFAYNAACS